MTGRADRAGGDTTTAHPTALRPATVVAVAASAGGVTALRTFVSRLPEDFPAAVLVVLHIPARGPTVLPEILSRAGPLPARHPDDGEPLAGGVILVAPPDRHLATSAAVPACWPARRNTGTGRPRMSCCAAQPAISGPRAAASSSPAP